MIRMMLWEDFSSSGCSGHGRLSQGWSDWEEAQADLGARRRLTAPLLCFLSPSCVLRMRAHPWEHIVALLYRHCPEKRVTLWR